MLTRLSATVFLLGVLVACSPAPVDLPSASGPSANSTAVPKPTAVSTTGAADSDVVETLLQHLSLEDKLHQMLMLHVYGSLPDGVTADEARANLRLYGVSTPAEVIQRWQPAGVILIRRNPQDAHAADLPTGNLETVEQISQLTRGLQDASATSGLGVPLLVITDEEGGPITRLPDTGRLLGGRQLGSTRNFDLARETAATIGRQLAEVGINQNLAPVADVDTNPDNPVIGDRAFGSDPHVVAGMVAAQVDGYHDAGIGATAKHFPGHGHADADSHLALPIIDLPEKAWKEVHLVPFEAAVAAGVDAIMTGHLAAPALDPSGSPATLSRLIVDGLLRGQLAYDGIVMTDSLWMGAVRNGRPDGVVAVNAVAAGCDVLVMPPEPAAAVEAIQDAVKNGSITMDRIDASVRRVFELKARLGLLEAPFRR